MNIVIIEDNFNLSFAIELLLKHNGYIANCFSTKEEFLKNIDKIQKVDIFIIDINLPDGDGLELLDDLKLYFEDSVYIVISAYTDMDHIKEAYKNGADDYLKKPFDIQELLLKIKKIETEKGIGNLIKIDNMYSFDFENKLLYCNKMLVSISPNEAEILFLLLSKRGNIATFEELYQNVWKKDVSNNIINVAIKRLREKLESQFIYAIHGVGYMIMA
ncbi:MAG: response regulator transcription factor [Nitrososphaeraceae archaeon]